MKKIADELRIVVKESDIEFLLQDPSSFRDSDKDGFYEHKKRIYQYLITRFNVDYFKSIDNKILKVGIKA